MATHEILPIPRIVNEIAEACKQAAIEVHRQLGPGLIESVYRQALLFELQERGLRAAVEVFVPLLYKGRPPKGGLRIDVLVEGCVVLEIKATEAMHPVHGAQLLSYLKLAGHRVGLLLNFHQETLLEGYQRITN